MIDEAEFKSDSTQVLTWPGGDIWIKKEGLQVRVGDCEYDCDVSVRHAVAFANAILKAYT